ncbi:MAG: hypothetical protein JWO39_2878, partial [Gemmatimonadetes bacterium]|nr:hypothetical protein [Gemmatimonadota bacterium]
SQAGFRSGSEATACLPIIWYNESCMRLWSQNAAREGLARLWPKLCA